nr:MAG TPA: hypothetical protein [Bacteriophage sp.]
MLSAQKCASSLTVAAYSCWAFSGVKSLISYICKVDISNKPSQFLSR